MGLDDKIGNKAEELSGAAKEKLGDATDNERLQAEGQNDQTKANRPKLYPSGHTSLPTQAEPPAR